MARPPHPEDAPFPTTPEPAPRPVSLRLLTGFLLVAPALHLTALALGRRWLNLGSPRAWDTAVYLVVAPLVGLLLLRRHERARFSVYVFLSCELLRASRLPSPTLAILALLALLALQSPAALRVHPRVDPKAVRNRIVALGRRRRVE